MRGVTNYSVPTGLEPIESSGTLDDGNTFRFYAKDQRWRFVVVSDDPNRPLPSDFYVEGAHPNAGYLDKAEVENLLASLIMLYYAQPNRPKVDDKERLLQEFP